MTFFRECDKVSFTGLRSLSGTSKEMIGTGLFFFWGSSNYVNL